MTTLQVKLELPDPLAKEAQAAGLLDPEQLGADVARALRVKRVEKLAAAREVLAANPLPPMTLEEIQAEIDAYRAEVRRAAGTRYQRGDLWSPVDGTPGKLIDAARAKSVTLCTSAVLLVELRGVLTREKFAKQLETRRLNAIEVFDGYAAVTHIVVPAIIQQTIVNDPSDDAVLACALAAKADIIVSGDRDLLTLKSFQQIPIVTAVEAVRITSRQ